MILLSIDSLIIGAGVIVFFLVTLVLVSVLLYAKKKLTPSGKVKVTINEEKGTRGRVWFINFNHAC